MAAKIDRRFDRESGKTLTYVTDETKRKEPFVIIPHRKGFASFEVFTHRGDVPKALEGSFTRPMAAQQAVVDYLANMQPTKTVKRDANAAEREARKKEES
jgi:hypothetical protein